MKYRKLGNTEELLSATGLGCMGMNYAYGEGDDAESIATLHKALDLGINFWDTADMYADGENEKLISQVLVPNRNRIFIATKFGFRKQADGSRKIDGSPAYIKSAVEDSLKRLRTDRIDLYYAHRVDPNVPVEETVGAMADLVKEGKVRYLGLSEASVTSIRKAHAVHPVSALQSEYSLLTRSPEHEILPLMKELQISFVPFSPLARGLVTNTLDLNNLAADDIRRSLPRYQEAYANNNRQLAAGFQEIAAAKGITPAQLALAWVLAQGENIIPIPGTKKRKYLLENAAAVDVELNGSDLADIEVLLKKYPDTGARYSEEMERLTNK
ncbi:aldo/keto reductase [uncultured Chitinophaga sp.]|uniref:aldo/keto reductase n=1 Tax=uncultured Chitinophaga sp. TaxID=339340 RepID=UPI0025F8C719|nr:aldo/keto reductase [uncultured Chitinophaga sp.]